MKQPIRVALVVPHLFLHRDIFPDVIFSPGKLALDLAEGLKNCGAKVTLFSPGPVDTTVNTVQADLSYFDKELAGRGYGYVELLKRHPFVFVSLSRQVQSEIIAKAYKAANNGEFDVVHIYTNEEDTALPFAELCEKPVVFTHHDPFSYMIKYKNNFPKYPHLNWISISNSQRAGMPANTNWVANIYNGSDEDTFKPAENPKGDYFAYFGRIIQPKGAHLAIKAVREYNKSAKTPIKLKIAGKHYADESSDTYWQEYIEPELDDVIEYVGFIKHDSAKREFLGNAKALIAPSTWDEPFGMVLTEALACGTPVIGLSSGAIPEIINSRNGILVEKGANEDATIEQLATALGKVEGISRDDCRNDFETRFTTRIMCEAHIKTYQELILKNN